MRVENLGSTLLKGTATLTHHAGLEVKAEGVAFSFAEEMEERSLHFPLRVVPGECYQVGDVLTLLVR